MLDEHKKRLQTESAKQQEIYQEMASKLQLDFTSQVEALVEELQREKEELRLSSKPNKATVLIDGDGCIFLEKLYAEGIDGGMRAARVLSSAVQDNVSHLIGPEAQIHIRIFYNKRGLSNTLSKAGITANIDDFAVGVNQAADRCLMVDVGCQKEAADAKIRAFFEDSVRDIRTSRVFFGGCHDNGYVSLIQSMVTAGYEDKIVLLPGYSEMACGIRDLHLPSLQIPNLFMSEKLLVLNSKPSLASIAGSIPRSNSPLPSYSQAVNRALPALKSDHLGRPRRGSAPVQRRPVPDVPLSKQRPPPCTLFYLADACKYDAECYYAHNYLLEAHHFEEIRTSAKKSPCPHVNKGDVCTWAENCVYGHKCPDGPMCIYLKAGRCKFKGVDMHKEETLYTAPLND